MLTDLVLSALQVTDFSSDTFQVIGGFAVNNLTATQCAATYPGTCFLDKTTLGVEMLCVSRVDGEPFQVTASHSGVTYHPEVTPFESVRLFGGRRKYRPSKLF